MRQRYPYSSEERIHNGDVPAAKVDGLATSDITLQLVKPVLERFYWNVKDYFDLPSFQAQHSV